MDETTTSEKGWWSTLPGLLTAISGIIVAVTGLIGALYQAGLLGDSERPPPVESAQETLVLAEDRSGQRPAPSTTDKRVAQKPAHEGSVSQDRREPPTAAAEPSDVAPPQASEGSGPASALGTNGTAPRPMSASQVVFTTTSGETAVVDASTLYIGFGKDNKALPLTNGQEVTFEKIRSVEVLGVKRTDLFKSYEDSAGQPEVRILLLNGGTVTGTVAVPGGIHGTAHFFFNGASDLGEFRIRPWQVEEISFER